MFRAGAAECRAQQMDRRFMRAQALHLVKSGSQGFLPGSTEDMLQGKEQD